MIALPCQVINDKNNPIEVVYIWELSRLSRKQTTLHKVKQFLIERGINLVCLSPSFCLLNSNGTINESGELIFSLFGTLSESEMRNKKARFARAKKANASVGRYSGGYVKYSYSIDSNGYHIINEDQAETVKLIFDLYLSTLSYSGVANELINRGYDMTSGKVLNILKSEEYCGEKVKEKSGNLRVYPQIISKDMFNKVKVQTQKNIKHTTKAKNIYFCSKLIKCPICGSFHVGSATNNKYYCYKSKINEKIIGRKKCSNNQTIDANYLDSIVWNSAFMYNTVYMYKQTKEDIEMYKKEIVLLNQKIKSVDKNINNIHAQIERADEVYIRKGKKEKYDNEVKKYGIVKLIWKYYLCLQKVMNCPRCGSLNYRKDGFVNSRQRYECK
ncbi:hypothetical protein EZS27_034263, partial [termite gut metagenome]